MKPTGKIRKASVRRGRAKQPSETLLNDLCRRLVVDLRDHGVCQKPGCNNNKARGDQIHWAHILTRQHKRAQWQEWNSLALCAGHHLAFDGEREKGLAWWRERFPERAVELDYYRSQRGGKLDRALTLLYLKQRIKEMGG